MAGHVTEAEILSLLKATFKRAAEHCDNLAVLPARGPTYRKLREDLQIAENCCRQVAWYRQDTRWLQVGLYMEEAHKRAGGWLRDRTMPRTVNSNLAHPLFLKLAENLRAGAASAERLETMATGTVGMILPKPLPAPTRTEGRPVQVLQPGEMPGGHGMRYRSRLAGTSEPEAKTPGGIILPPGMAA